MNYRRGAVPSWVTREKCSISSPASIGSIRQTDWSPHRHTSCWLQETSLIRRPCLFMRCGKQILRTSKSWAGAGITWAPYWMIIAAILFIGSSALTQMKREDVQSTVHHAVKKAGLKKGKDRSCSVIMALVMYPVNWRNIYQLWGSDQYTDVLPIRRHKGKIERYHRSMKMSSNSIITSTRKN